MTLADRIEKKIRDIPANNPGYISFIPETIGTVLSRRLIRQIAEVAAKEVRSFAQRAAEV